MKGKLLLAGSLSLILHGLGFGAFVDPDEIIIQGGAPTQVARLGNSFADMVSGTVQPVEPETEDAAVAEDTPPVEPTETPTDSPERPEELVPEPPVQTEVQPPEETSPVEEPSVVEPAPQFEVETATPTEMAALPPITATEGVIVAPMVLPTPPTESIESAPARRSETPPELQPATEPDAVTETAVEPDLPTVDAPVPVKVQQADANTPRPRTRPEPERPQATTRVQSQGGNQDTRRGQNDGRRDANANTAASSNARATRQGNSAAASNYAGIVWTKISRGGRARGLGRGKATVAFRIASNGGLAGLGIAKSSGNARIDRAALAHIRRAAPFPPPPQGARTAFQFEYEVSR